MRNEREIWTNIRAAFRDVTQEPWTRIPKKSKTLLLNPIETCLAGGRNKEITSQAYDTFKQRFADKGIGIFTPKTITNVSFGELPKYFDILGGSMVIKVQDSNAGKGVFTVVNRNELDFEMSQIDPKDRYLVQELIHSNYTEGLDPTLAWYHVGTISDSKGRSFAFDIRMMMHATEDGIRPLAVYSRRSGHPLNQPLPENLNSWRFMARIFR